MSVVTKPPDDGYKGWGLPTISPSPALCGIGLMGWRHGPGLNQARDWGDLL